MKPLLRVPVECITSSKHAPITSSVRLVAVQNGTKTTLKALFAVQDTQAHTVTSFQGPRRCVSIQGPQYIVGVSCLRSTVQSCDPGSATSLVDLSSTQRQTEVTFTRPSLAFCIRRVWPTTHLHNIDVDTGCSLIAKYQATIEQPCPQAPESFSTHVHEKRQEVWYILISQELRRSIIYQGGKGGGW